MQPLKIFWTVTENKMIAFSLRITVLCFGEVSAVAMNVIIGLDTVG